MPNIYATQEASEKRRLIRTKKGQQKTLFVVVNRKLFFSTGIIYIFWLSFLLTEAIIIDIFGVLSGGRERKKTNNWSMMILVNNAIEIGCSESNRDLHWPKKPSEFHSMSWSSLSAALSLRRKHRKTSFKSSQMRSTRQDATKFDTPPQFLPLIPPIHSDFHADVDFRSGVDIILPCTLTFLRNLSLLLIPMKSPKAQHLSKIKVHCSLVSNLFV